MTVDGAAVVCRRATPEDSLRDLTHAVIARAQTVRGGRALLEQLWGSEVDPEDFERLLHEEISAGHLWVAQRDGEVVAGALVAQGCVRAIWVRPDCRRQRIASCLLSTLLDGDTPPHDAWALPGDRATKSLYESVGWKARLLTMRGE